jgi:4-hydroxy-3-methylbut-2-enyl diphosphate reductase
VTTIGVTSGASVPEELVAAVLDKLAGHGFGDVEEVEAVEEHMTFALPRELRPARTAEAGAAEAEAAAPIAPAAPGAPAGPAGSAGSGSRQPG